MNDRPVTVSVVSHGHGDAVVHLLQDLSAYATKEVGRVIVTLNVPESRLSDAVNAESWPFEIDWICNSEPLGYGANHNQAYALCQSSCFCVLNPDVRLNSNPYPVLLASLAMPNVGCAYPLQHGEDGKIIDPARAVPTPISLFFRYFLPASQRYARCRDWVNGAFMLFRSEVFESISGFDQQFFMYCEDVDICLRLQLQGYELRCVPSAVIEHEGQRASRRKLRHLIWHIRSLIKLWVAPSYQSYKVSQRQTPQLK